MSRRSDSSSSIIASPSKRRRLLDRQTTTTTVGARLTSTPCVHLARVLPDDDQEEDDNEEALRKRLRSTLRTRDLQPVDVETWLTEWHDKTRIRPDQLFTYFEKPPDRLKVQNGAQFSLLDDREAQAWTCATLSAAPPSSGDILDEPIPANGEGVLRRLLIKPGPLPSTSASGLGRPCPPPDELAKMVHTVDFAHEGEAADALVELVIPISLSNGAKSCPGQSVPHWTAFEHELPLSRSRGRSPALLAPIHWTPQALLSVLRDLGSLGARVRPRGSEPQEARRAATNAKGDQSVEGIVVHASIQKTTDSDFIAVLLPRSALCRTRWHLAQIRVEWTPGSYMPQDDGNLRKDGPSRSQNAEDSHVHPGHRPTRVRFPLALASSDARLLAVRLAGGAQEPAAEDSQATEDEDYDVARSTASDSVPTAHIFLPSPGVLLPFRNPVTREWLGLC
ncbi:hypothetical protein V8E36_000963 [Tilletia maclaganii]